VLVPCGAVVPPVGVALGVVVCGVVWAGGALGVVVVEVCVGVLEVGVVVDGVVCVLDLLALLWVEPPNSVVFPCEATEPPNTSSGTVRTTAAIANATAAVAIAAFRWMRRRPALCER
jgi:hypothetical protein